jgi:hypothetical protein
MGIKGKLEHVAKPAGSKVQPKPVRWVGSSKIDLSRFPEEVRRCHRFYTKLTYLFPIFRNVAL